MWQLWFTNLLEKLRWRKRKPPFSKEQVLASKPLRNPQLEWEKNEDGEMVVTIRRRSSWKAKALGLLFPIPNQRTIVLDEPGTFVWEMCDGETDIQTMMRRLAQRYQLNIKEAELSLTTYLRNMGKRGLVGFAISATNGSKSQASSGEQNDAQRSRERKRRRKRKR